jgi:hypothetical protein
MRPDGGSLMGAMARERLADLLAGLGIAFATERRSPDVILMRVGKDAPARTSDRAICDDRHHTNLVRTAPLLRADMILGKDKCG